MLHLEAAIITAGQNAQRKWLVPTSDSIAQYGVESGWGRYMPPGSNNPFGIKAHGNQPSVTVKTREVDKHGHSYYIDAPFRKFDSIDQAFDEHAKLLATAPIYKDAMDAWTKPPYDLDLGVRLMAKHYATAPDYATLLLSIIHSNNLQQYDRV